MAYSTSPGRMTAFPASITVTPSWVWLKGPSVMEIMDPLSVSTRMEASTGSGLLGRRTLEPWNTTWFDDIIGGGQSTRVGRVLALDFEVILPVGLPLHRGFVPVPSNGNDPASEVADREEFGFDERAAHSVSPNSLS